MADSYSLPSTGRMPGARHLWADPQELGLGDDVQIVEELSRGVQTTVYRIRRGGVDYALKVLHGMGPADGAVLAAFRREAALLARIDHPGVPRVFDVGSAGGHPYLVLEFIDGRPLTRRLAAGTLSEDELIRLAGDVAAVLTAAHRCGLVHRDIKPANIIATASGRARLIDFGLATAGRGGPPGDEVVGTFDYSAPEQTGMLARPVDGRADLYALGVVMFQCATGELPFQAGDVAQLLAMHATVPAPDPRELRPELTAGLAELIGRLLAKEPDERIPTAQELCVALSRIGGPGRLAAGSAEAAPGDVGVPGLHLVGRDREQAALRERWQRTRDGAGGVALLHGPTGSGKSSLAARLAATAQADGALVLSGKCDADSALPLAPLRSAIDGYMRTVAESPAESRAAAVKALREAAGVGAGLLGPLSPVLALLLDAPRLAAGERHEQFAGAVAYFLAALATRHGGLLLVLDDVHWLDPASRAILRRLAEELDAPVLVLATMRDDDADTVAAFAAAVGDHLDLRVPVGQLGEEGTARLVTEYLAGSAVSPEIVSELASRGKGNPFTILEYLNALVEAGALRPSWGTWRMDTDRLQAIDLPGDVFALVLGRIARLGEQAREVLTVAAAVGSRFDAALLDEVTGGDPAPALAEAVQHGVLHATHDGYAFVHDRIRESLLSAVDPAGLRRLHQRIAVALDARGGTEPAAVYALAHHYAGGQTERTPQRLIATGWAAGRLALDENAPSAAVPFLEAAVAVAELGGFALDGRLRDALAVAYLATGQAEAARDRLEGALAGEADPLRRAAMRLQLSAAARMRWELTRAVEHVRAGLAELGRPLPRNPALLGVLVLTWLLRWLACGVRRPSERPVTGEAAERLRLEARLYQAGATAVAMGVPTALLPACGLRPARWLHRLGAGSEYVVGLTVTGVLTGAMHWRRRRDRIFRRCQAIAADLRDPKLTARAAWMEGYARWLTGDGSITELADLAEAHHQWLEVDFHSNAVLLRARHLLARGYAREALDWHDRGRARLSDSTAEVFAGFALAEAAARSLLGEVPEIPPLPCHVAQSGPDVGYWVHCLPGTVQVAVEQDELGAPFEEAVMAFHRLDAPPSALLADRRMIYVYDALGRLTRAQRARADRRPELLAAAAVAMRRLRKAANDPLLRGYRQIMDASLEQLRDRPDRALARLARAERLLARLDAPLAHYEAARVRARALHALGDEAAATLQADIALLLATRHGWARRARWVRAEFGTASVVSTTVGSGGGGHGSGGHGSGGHGSGRTRQTRVDAHRYRRRLDALQQVSAAAASVLDPQELARIALDQTLRIFGAERAVLFQTGDDGALRVSLGRTGAGDLTELTGYSASLVERVAAERRPLVVTGADEGAALGSHSAIVHGLRSIMIAPLELDGRLLGVVYLDSRVARGVFTDEDIGVLTAVANQVAVSLETARAARLEAAVSAARRQRDTAETLREAMAEFSATFDPEEVLHRLREIVGRAVHADVICLLQHDGARPCITGTAAAEPSKADATELLALTCPRSGLAHTAPRAVTALLGTTRAWLAIPLRTRGGDRGVMVAGSQGSEEFGPVQLDIAVALAGQGAAAYDNARLFAQVREFATIDGLTGVFNRRHFTDLARAQLSMASRNSRPLVGMMVDIDHFKKINDAYGHSTGDDVIRAVAAALRTKMRPPDVLCRYGGEEFALIMSEMHGDALDVAERLRRTVADLAVPGPTGPVSVTVSIGVADLKPDDDLTGLLNRADEALYRAKQGGRNQVKAG